MQSRECPDVSPVPVAPVEQRSSVRRRKLYPVQVAASRKLSQAFRGWSVDHSLGGFRLLLPCKFEIDRLLRIRPANAGPSVPWLKVRVRNCLPQDDQWQIGCELLSSPSYGVLLLFW